MSAPALFLDRDGTLVHARHYPRRPDELVLYDGIGPRLKRLRDAGYRLVVVTNQSGLARGYFTEADLGAMHDHLRAELVRSAVEIDAVVFCPHHPDGTVAEWAFACECRKPMPGMLTRAAADLDLDLTRSWMVGDILDDVEAGHRAGCRSILVDLGTESPPPTPARTPDYVARDTAHALDLVAALDGHDAGGVPDVAYRPVAWPARSGAEALNPGSTAAEPLDPTREALPAARGIEIPPLTPISPFGTGHEARSTVLSPGGTYRGEPGTSVPAYGGEPETSVPAPGPRPPACTARSRDFDRRASPNRRASSPPRRTVRPGRRPFARPIRTASVGRQGAR